jgi:anti-sigma B factor antagonist
MSPAEPAADAEAGGGATLRLIGDIDLASETMWRARGDAVLAQSPAARTLTLDMSEVSFLDSRGMAMLVHLYSRVLEREGSLVLTGVPRRVGKALSVAGLDQLFELHAG